MSERGLCSRREADYFIERGWVLVNGVKCNQLGSKFPDSVKIVLDRGAQNYQASQVTVILNKPVGYVSNMPEGLYREASVLLTWDNISGDRPQEEDIMAPCELTGLAVAGRLDIDSQGLMIFTQDGQLAKKIIGENTDIDKEYLVRVSGQLDEDDMHTLRSGVLEFDGRRLKPAQVDWINQDQLRFVLREGMKRQVRRMCEAVGLEVLALKRVRIGKLRLRDLEEGKWRYLSPEDQI